MDALDAFLLFLGFITGISTVTILLILSYSRSERPPGGGG